MTSAATTRFQTLILTALTAALGLGAGPAAGADRSAFTGRTTQTATATISRSPLNQLYPYQAPTTRPIASQDVAFEYLCERRADGEIRCTRVTDALAQLDDDDAERTREQLGDLEQLFGLDDAVALRCEDPFGETADGSSPADPATAADALATWTSLFGTESDFQSDGSISGDLSSAITGACSAIFADGSPSSGGLGGMNGRIDAAPGMDFCGFEIGNTPDDEIAAMALEHINRMMEDCDETLDGIIVDGSDCLDETCQSCQTLASELHPKIVAECSGGGDIEICREFVESAECCADVTDYDVDPRVARTDPDADFVCVTGEAEIARQICEEQCQVADDGCQISCGNEYERFLGLMDFDPLEQACWYINWEGCFTDVPEVEPEGVLESELMDGGGDGLAIKVCVWRCVKSKNCEYCADGCGNSYQTCDDWTSTDISVGEDPTVQLPVQPLAPVESPHVRPTTTLRLDEGEAVLGSDLMEGSDGLAIKVCIWRCVKSENCEYCADGCGNSYQTCDDWAPTDISVGEDPMVQLEPVQPPAPVESRIGVTPTTTLRVHRR